MSDQRTNPPQLWPLVLDFLGRLYDHTGREPERLVLPPAAYDIVARELREHCKYNDAPAKGPPITGFDGPVLWLACTRLERDKERP